MPTPPRTSEQRVPRSASLLRPRLVAPLLDGASLTVVSAPAGSGKTTLLHQVQERAGVAAAYYQARPEHADEAALVAGVRRAVVAAGSDIPRAGGDSAASLS